MTQPTELRGAILGRGYRLSERPAGGGPEPLFEAEHDRLPGRFAIRIFPLEALAKPEAAVRIQRALRVASLLRDPHVVQLLDFSIGGETPTFGVFERGSGEPLSEVLARSGALALEQVVEIADAVSVALEAGHRLGLVHGDLRAELVLISPSGTHPAQVAGFGWSKELRQAAIEPSPSRHLAPEQRTGEPAAVDERADQFALASLILEMLGASPRANALGGTGPSTGGGRGVPTAVDAVLRRATADDPAERFASIRELASRLRSAAAEAEVEAPPPESVETPSPAAAAMEAPREEPQAALRQTPMPLVSEVAEHHDASIEDPRTSGDPFDSLTPPIRIDVEPMFDPAPAPGNPQPQAEFEEEEEEEEKEQGAREVPPLEIRVAKDDKVVHGRERRAEPDPEVGPGEPGGEDGKPDGKPNGNELNPLSTDDGKTHISRSPFFEEPSAEFRVPSQDSFQDPTIATDAKTPVDLASTVDLHDPAVTPTPAGATVSRVSQPDIEPTRSGDGGDDGGGDALPAVEMAPDRPRARRSSPPTGAPRSALRATLATTPAGTPTDPSPSPVVTAASVADSDGPVRDAVESDEDTAPSGRRLNRGWTAAIATAIAVLAIGAFILRGQLGSNRDPAPAPGGTGEGGATSPNSAAVGNGMGSPAAAAIEPPRGAPAAPTPATPGLPTAAGGAPNAPAGDLAAPTRPLKPVRVLIAGKPVRTAPSSNRAGGLAASQGAATAKVSSAESPPRVASNARAAGTRAAAKASPAAAAGGAPAVPALACVVRLTSRPTAEIWLDDKDTGKRTPLDGYRVACGPHKLVLKRPDQDIEQMEMIDVKRGQPFRRAYELE